MVTETVSDGFGGLAYIHFGAFTIDDGIDEVSTGAGKGICEVEGLFRDSRGGDGMVGKELWTGTTEGMMAGLYMVVFRIYLQGMSVVGGGAFPNVLAETRWLESAFSLL